MNDEEKQLALADQLETGIRGALPPGYGFVLLLFRERQKGVTVAATVDLRSAGQIMSNVVSGIEGMR